MIRYLGSESSGAHCRRTPPPPPPGSVLTRLVLEGCPHVTDETMGVIRAKAYRLQHLNLRGCAITDTGIRAAVTACRGLKELILADVGGLRDPGVQAISEAIRMYCALRVLDLSGSRHFSNEAILLLLQDGGGALTRLRLKGCTQLNELGLMGLRRSGRFSMGLTSLDLSHTSVADPALCWVSEGCKKLLHLSLAHCSHLGDSALHYLADASVWNGMRLLSLSLAGCRLVTDYGTAPLAQSPALAALTSLDVSGCVFVGEATVAALGLCCHDLRSLTMAGVTKYTDANLKALAHGCPGLTALDLSIDLSYLDTSSRSRIPRYTGAGLRHIADGCRGLQVGWP
jgi:F-box and leucine-rich repeat protein 2/20